MLETTLKIVTALSLAGVLMGCGGETEHRFDLLPPESTGITFTNQTGENDSFNILTNEYIFNGGGVGVGDFNGDDLPDLFFTGAATENKLYLNSGNFQFEDVTINAGVGGGTRWNNGVTVVDVNNDGLQDIYVCATTRDLAADRANQLFLNRGMDANGIPTFKDVAPRYGIADTTHNTQAAWLDYDGDGDLDLFLLINEMVDNKRPNDFSNKVKDGTGKRTDKLYRQDQDGDRISFTEVGKETGILYQGFSLAATVCDLNRDGWPDIYVSNDYLSNDLAYLNTERDGQRYFEEISYQITKHTSFSAMGNDVADLNNDGLPDIVAVDMLPVDNLRRKMMLGANNYNYLINLRRFDVHPQFTRNTLQLSQGQRTDSLSGLPQYGEVAMQAGLPATDWSWSPLVADFDLDGRKDIIITNGFPRDITDKDFGDYNLNNNRYLSPGKLLPMIPSVKIPNVAYRMAALDDGIPIFEDVSRAWGISAPSFSNGAAYVDLDGDGDLDYVTNNIYDPAHVYRNNTVSGWADDPNPITIKAADGLHDVDWFGSEIIVAEGDSLESFFLHPHRGYLSSQSRELRLAGAYGAGARLFVRWPGGGLRDHGLLSDPTNRLLHPDGGVPITDLPTVFAPATAPLFSKLSSSEYRHEDMDYIDFNVQPMLLRKLSEQGPGLAVSDVNGDGYDDVYVSGSLDHHGTFLLGSEDGLTTISSLIESPVKAPEELGALFFDADNDGDEDLYIVSGSYEYEFEEGDYADRLYENKGGRFTQVQNGLANEALRSGSCVRASDYDNDGDLDLFVGARVEPHAYPTPVRSTLYRNESTPGNISFVVDEANSTAISSATNVSDGLFTDVDNDGVADLLVAGEWSPIRCYLNENGRFVESTEAAGLSEALGWWSSITPGDFDNDGDIDYVVGNVGDNSILRPTIQHPVTAFAGDIDGNQGYDFIPFTYLKDESGGLRSFPLFGRTDFAKQVNKIKADHLTHRSFADTDAETYLAGIDDKNLLRVSTGKSVMLENQGGQFIIHSLPASAQSSPLFGGRALDLNEDDLLDIILVGNESGVETSQGNLNAGNGLVFLNQGNLRFRSVPASQSGLSVPGDGRALVTLNTPTGRRIAAAQNKGPIVLLAIEESRNSTIAGRKTEQYFGSGYLSQDGNR